MVALTALVFDRDGVTTDDFELSVPDGNGLTASGVAVLTLDVID